MKTLEEIEEYINAAEAEHNKAIDEYADKILVAQQELEKAKSEMVDAEETVNVDDYSKAKDKIRTAKNAIELYKKHKVKLESQGIVDYQEVKASIMEVAAAANDEYVNQSVEPVKQLLKLSEQSWSNVEKANDLIDKISGKGVGYSRNHQKEFLPEILVSRTFKDLKQLK